MMGDSNPSSDTHVLNDEWTFYLNERPPKGISQEEYERSIHKWGVFSTIEVRLVIRFKSMKFFFKIHYSHLGILAPHERVGYPKIANLFHSSNVQKWD
jgi:hypothetical protein